VFFARKSILLGHVISADGIATNPSKLEKVYTNLPEECTGLANYYRCFIQDFAKVAKPLTN